MKIFNLELAIKQIKDKYDSKLLVNPIALQKIIYYEYKVDVELEKLEKLYENTEDLERESRIIEYGRN